ncbi:MAG: CvpA family protein [Firmicutes bacterium]|nr:CvpA family protein [Bacillota bacterium]
MSITAGFGIGIVDIVIVLAVIIFAILGWKHGFLVKIVEMASGIFGLLASIILARPFSTVLDKWIGEPIGQKITEYLLSRTDLFSGTLNETNVRAAFEGMSLPTFMVDWIVQSIDFNQLTITIVDAITPVIKSLALLVIAFLVLFFGSMVVFFILKLLAKMITSIPIIKQVDKILGVLFGLLKISAIVYILLFVLALLITIPAINDLIGPFLISDMALQDPDQFRLSKWLYNNNILQQLINFFI